MQSRSIENHSAHATAVWQALITSSHAEHSKQDHTAYVEGHGYYQSSGLVFAWQVTRDKGALLGKVRDVKDGDWMPRERTEMRRMNKITLAGMVAEWETPQPDDDKNGWCWVCKEGAAWAVSVALAATPAERVERNHLASVEAPAGEPDEDRAARHQAKAVRDADYFARLAVEAKLTPRAERIAGVNDALAKIGLEPLTEPDDEDSPRDVARYGALMTRQAAEIARKSAFLFMVDGQPTAMHGVGVVAEQLDLLAQQLDLFTADDYLARLAK